MKKSVIARITCILLSSAICFSLAGCKNKASEDTLSAEDYTDTYKATSLTVDNEIKGDVSSFDYYNGRIYFLSQYLSDKDADTEFYLNSVNIDGTDFKEKLLVSSDSKYLCQPKFNSDGKGYYIEYLYTDNGNQYFLKTIDADGNELSSVDLSEKINSCFPNGFFASDISFDSNKNITIADYSQFTVINQANEVEYYYRSPLKTTV